MKTNKLLIFFISLSIFMGLFLSTSLYADYAENYRLFDSENVEYLKKGKNIHKSDVIRLFGDSTSKAQFNKNAQGCVELWVYSKTAEDEESPEKTEFLYVGFDEKEFVCSVGVKIKKNVNTTGNQ